MSDLLLFHDEPSLVSVAPAGPAWRVLVVDDDVAVHDVTELALGDFQFEGRSLEFVRCTSAAEAREAMALQGDVAVALIDVVMETDNAGLDLVRWIRENHLDNLVRIVVRTGQPGLAPKLDVVEAYDIHDYKEKTELTKQRLHMTMFSALRAYRDILALRQNLNCLKRTIASVIQVSQSNNLTGFATALQRELAVLLSRPGRQVIQRDLTIYMEHRAHGARRVLAAVGGEFAGLMCDRDAKSLNPDVRRSFELALAERDSTCADAWFVGYHRTVQGAVILFYVRSDRGLSEVERHLIDVFSANVSAMFQTLLLKQEVEETQKELVYLLGEAVERRSGETGAHVVRVGLVAGLLARAYGVSQQEADLIALAAPLHDAGKVAIPDDVLNKPGKLTADEWKTMQTHALIGAELLSRSTRRVPQLGAIIAAQHHEKWNGKGYPHGLAGMDIHVAARATALADVFDALLSKRCYKEPWPMDRVIELIGRESGSHFEPRMVDLFLANLGAILDIREAHPDGVALHEAAA